jgi:hypothetical protein
MTNATVTVLWTWPGTWLHSKSAEASTPPWLADAVMVQRALEAKGASPPGSDFWRRVVELVRRVDGALKGDLEQLDYATRLVVELAASLPDPCAPDYDPRMIGVDAARRYRPCPAADISACVTLIAAELTDPRPSYLSGLASVLDELAMALLLHPRPAPGRSVARIVVADATPRHPLLLSAQTAGAHGPPSEMNALEPIASASQPSNKRHQYGAPKS